MLNLKTKNFKDFCEEAEKIRALFQLLPNSCSATAIAAMFSYALIKSGKVQINSESDLRQLAVVLQLSIYSKIWEQPYQMSNLEKALNYMLTNGFLKIKPEIMEDIKDKDFFVSSRQLASKEDSEFFYFFLSKAHVYIQYMTMERGVAFFNFKPPKYVVSPFLPELSEKEYAVPIAIHDLDCEKIYEGYQLMLKNFPEFLSQYSSSLSEGKKQDIELKTLIVDAPEVPAMILSRFPTFLSQAKAINESEAKQNLAQEQQQRTDACIYFSDTV